MEVQKQETCVSENNAATEQRQRRVTDKSKLDNTIATLMQDIKQATDDMAELTSQNEDLNTNIVDSKKARSTAHDEYKKSVQEQLNQQKLLHNAIAALRKFYAAKKDKSLLQAPPAQSTQVEPTAAGVKLVVAADQPIAPVPQSGLPRSIAPNTTSKQESPVQVPTVKLVAQTPTQAPQTKEQQALDDGVKENMDTKWGNVKDAKAKRVEKPKGFAKPLKAHTGTTGIIGILQIILQDSESLIEQDVKDEQSESDLHLANVQQTKEVIEGKEKEITMLDKGKNDNELKKTQNEQQLAAVTKEMEEIDDFLAIVDKQCKTFLVNFESNQQARAEEISDTLQAKSVLLGMAEDGAMDGAAALTQLARTAETAQGVH